MPWVPKTDFEEEVVNLQPDHDFIYGTLSERQYTYPRPQSHIEYAFSKKLEKKKQQENGGSNQINAKLTAIAEVQRMASTKPLGEQPAEDDWDNNGKIEQETIGMLRYHGIPLSVEQPLNEKVTIATYPVENGIKVIRNGRRKMAYFFDDKVFQLKEKKRDSSPDIEDYKTNDNSVTPNHMDNERLSDNSFNTTSSLSSHGYSTCGNESSFTYSFNSAVTDNETPLDQQLIAQRLQQYDKLLEDTASLKLSGSNNTSPATNSSDSFKTSKAGGTNWRPLPNDYDPEVIVNNSNENWPDLLKTNTNNKACNLSSNSNNVLNKSSSIAASATESNGSSNSSRGNAKTNFLERFIEPTYLDKTKTDFSKLPNEPKTFASVTKKVEKPKASDKANYSEFPAFYTPRKMYALKRQAK